MTLENIYYIGQTVAVVAILATLIALIIQMRNASRLARKAALKNQIDGLERMPRALFETPGLADIYVRGIQDIEALTDTDRMIFLSFCRSALRIWEGLYTQYMDGDIDPETWKMHRKQLRSEIGTPGMQEVWKRLRQLHSERFQEFLDELLAEAIALANVDAKPSLKPKSDEEAK